jgi:hypothetical protein
LIHLEPGFEPRRDRLRGLGNDPAQLSIALVEDSAG